MDTNLVVFRDEMAKPNFLIFLKLLWIKILRQIKELIRKEASVTFLLKTFWPAANS
jgi:hypothetical protein